MQHRTPGPHAPVTPFGTMGGVGSTITAADDAFLSIIGYDRADLDEGRIDWRALTPPEFLHLDEAGMRQAAETGGFTTPYEKAFIRKDGRRVPVLLVCAFVPGKPDHWMGYVLDLSPNRRSPRLLAEETVVEPHGPVPGVFIHRLLAELVNERTRRGAMLDSTDSLVWSVDLQYRLLGANAAFQQAQQRYSGHALGVGASVMSASFPAERLAQWRDWYDRAALGERITRESRVPGANGECIREYTLSPMHDPEGRVYGVTVVAHDVTARHQAEAALRQSEQRFRSLAAASPFGIFLTDARGRVVYANERISLICGLPVPFNLADVEPRVHPDDATATFAEWEALVRDGRDAVLEFRFRRPDGATRHLRAWLTCLREGGAVTGFIGSVEDATERHALSVREQQRQRIEALGKLAGGIAHDFNNMLGVILGHTELALGEAGLPGSAARSLEQIRAASLRARDLVQQVVTFGRRTDDDLATVDLAELARESFRLLRATLPASITLEMRLPPAAVPVTGHPASLQQVIVNLCLNAVHAVRDVAEPRVVLDVFADRTLDPPVVTLAVVDNGHGMAPDVVARIFEPFFTTKPAGEGSGLGLSVVHQTIEVHGGSIAVESTPGAGTTFRITLPLGAEVSKRTEKQLDPASGSGRILLVDDEPELARTFAHVLRRAGFDVFTVADGVSATELLGRAGAGPDLVLSDLSMPGMSGDSLARILLGTHPTLPVILMSGFGVAMTTPSSNVVEVLAKPVSAGVLVAAVRGALETRRGRASEA